MDKEQLEMFRRQLQQKKQEIMAEAGKTMTEMTDQTTNVPDPNDRATLESGRSFELRIRDRERRLLVKIDEAVARIDDGTYGICEDCGAEISEARLKARPVTTQCIDCKIEAEEKEKRH